jgi:predicted GNAT family acetyltransferase
MSREVVHSPSTSRYLLLKDDVEIGHASYSIRGDEFMITGTFVDPTHRNGGVGAIMVKRVIDDILATTDKRITSGCWFVTMWLERHPGYIEAARDGGVDAELGTTCRIVN